jgi:M6 family metalloprotease-like protein
VRRFLAVAAIVSAAGAASFATPFGATAGAGGACRPAPTVPGVTEGRSGPGTVAPSTGVLRAALLLVHAADAPPDDSVAPPQDLIDAAADWYRTVSYGRLEFRVETPPRWFALPGRSAEYAADPVRYFRDAVAAADPHVDFSRIDVVYLSPASGTPVESGTFAVLNSFGVRADGKEVGFWIPFGPGFAAESGDVGHLLHETGHLLGLPDLYSPNAGLTFHRWDVMAARWPSELLAWHRWKLGWIDERAIVCIARRATRTVTLAPLERPGGTKAVFVKRGNLTFAVEVRARAGYDRTLCETGVLVYAVDQTPFKRAPIHIHRAQPDRRTPAQCAAAWNAPFDVARREVRTLRLTGLRVDVLAKRPDGSFRVRVETS